MHPMTLSAITLVCLSALATPAAAQGFASSLRVAGIANVTAIAYPPGERNRLFILDQRGVIRILEQGSTLRATPFLDASAAVGGSQNGATGLAFAPDYATSGQFFIFHSAPAGQVVLARYQSSPADPNLAKPESRTIILQRPGTAQHTGGWIDFGPDGYLYISGGDAWRNDSGSGSPQGINDWTGKFFRIDVRGDDFPTDPLRNYAVPPSNPFAGAIPGLDEVWALGIRNAYRCSFDRLTGDLWIADVGGTQREEVNLESAGDPGGRNYGWPCWEGTWRGSGCQTTGPHTPPVLDLSRSVSTCILGGYVYRGCANRDMQGRYTFSRCWSSVALWSFDPKNPAGTLVQQVPAGVAGSVLGFGEDAEGELYMCTTNGLYKLLPPPDAFTDCNANGRPDACEIADGSASDVNQDGLPDSCTRLCPADFDASGALAIGDLFFFLQRWFAAAPDADFNHDAAIGAQDLLDFVGAYLAGCA